MPGNLKNLHSYSQESVLLLLQYYLRQLGCYRSCCKFTEKLARKGWAAGEPGSPSLCLAEGRDSDTGELECGSVECGSVEVMCECEWGGTALLGQLPVRRLEARWRSRKVQLNACASFHFADVAQRKSA